MRYHCGMSKRATLALLGVAAALASASGCWKQQPGAARPPAPPPTAAQRSLTEARDLTKRAEEAERGKRTAEALTLYLRARERIGEGIAAARPEDREPFRLLSDKVERKVVELEWAKKQAEDAARRDREAAELTKGVSAFGPTVTVEELERQKKADEAARKAQSAAELDKLSKFGPTKESSSITGQIEDDSDPSRPGKPKVIAPPPKPTKPKTKRR